MLLHLSVILFTREVYPKCNGAGCVYPSMQLGRWCVSQHAIGQGVKSGGGGLCMGWWRVGVYGDELLVWPSVMAFWCGPLECVCVYVGWWRGGVWVCGVNFWYDLLPCLLACHSVMAIWCGLLVWLSTVAFCCGLLVESGLLLWPWVSGLLVESGLLLWPWVPHSQPHPLHTHMTIEADGTHPTGMISCF